MITDLDKDFLSTFSRVHIWLVDKHGVEDHTKSAVGPGLRDEFAGYDGGSFRHTHEKVEVLNSTRTRFVENSYCESEGHVAQNRFL